MSGSSIRNLDIESENNLLYEAISLANPFYEFQSDTSIENNNCVEILG